MDFTNNNKKISRYRGFSSYNFEQNGTFSITDVDLIKTDLMNHIFTRTGERVMMPTYGTIIPDLIFEPLDADMVETVTDEINMVINFDPRVEMISLDVTPNFDTHTLTAALTVRYVELNVSDSFNFNIIFNDL